PPPPPDSRNPGIFQRHALRKSDLPDNPSPEKKINKNKGTGQAGAVFYHAGPAAEDLFESGKDEVRTRARARVCVRVGGFFFARARVYSSDLIQKEEKEKKMSLAGRSADVTIRIFFLLVGHFFPRGTRTDPGEAAGFSFRARRAVRSRARAHTHLTTPPEGARPDRHIDLRPPADADAVRPADRPFPDKAVGCVAAGRGR
ncbi:MAG: hypothetical protein BJ554DRAFT_5043, partial [Olpidium bornovanus]